jgi:alkylation response protein AidB-like acyl-CoA dehydrogenase
MNDPQFLFAHCLTEPKGASDRWLPYNVPEAKMDTKAVLENGEWLINGRKHYISNGYDASLYVVYANTDPKVGMLQGTSSFLVPRDTPGLAVTRCNETIGGRYMNNGEITFEDCRIPEANILARDNALGQAGIYFRPGKILQAAKNLGIGLAAFEDTSRFVQEHVQGGKTLIQHQAIAVRLAQMAVKLEAVGAMLRHVARAVDENTDDASKLCHMIKVFASEEIFEVTRQALEIHGGHGAMLEMGIEKYFRDAAVFLHMDATVDVSCFKIVKEMFPDTAGTYAGSG